MEHRQNRGQVTRSFGANDLSPVSVEDGPFRLNELEPPFFMSKLKLTPNLQMVSLVQRLVPFLTTDSRTYRISMKTETGRAEAVFREKVTDPGMEVLSWHEN